MEKKIAHLQFIQEVIKRMAGNSFLIKGWSVTLVSALFVLSSKDKLMFFAFLTYIPIFVFWLLDGYFLWQERLFRRLYDKVRIIDEDKIDFSMSIEPVSNVETWSSACLSKTLLIFHGTLFVSVVIIMFLIIKIVCH